MARYTSLFSVATLDQNFRDSLVRLLQACRFEIVYSAHDYLMAREIPGQVNFSQLVTAEILIEEQGDTAPEARVKMNLVLKNEALPLNRDNHCSQVFSQLEQAIVDYSQWEVLEFVRS